MPWVKVGDLRLHYESWGAAGSSAGMVLVHGLGSTCHIWDFTAPLLAERGLRVIAFDQRGHGESDQPDTGYDFPSVVADLVGFVDAVGLSEPSVLVGHSWGASVVLHFAAAHRDRTAGIALVDGGTSSPGERWSWEETETRLRPPELDGMQWTDLLQRMSSNDGAFPQSRAELIGRSVFRVDSNGYVTRKFRISNHMQIVRAMWEQRPADLLAGMTCPVLLLPARRSTDTPDLAGAKADGIARAQTIQPTARVRWFEETVHDVPLQRPEELADELVALASHALASRAST